MNRKKIKKEQGMHYICIPSDHSRERGRYYFFLFHDYWRLNFASLLLETAAQNMSNKTCSEIGVLSSLTTTTNSEVFLIILSKNFHL